ncbi:S-adenosyl-L-methionine-dependent methyltransferase [Backusella circina FSU 941]|nr:S-adenosyl-L-methionine-dependent methyltransferase [Backusella circina FSU 941]
MSNRRFHHVTNSAYWFPNDDEEMDRLIGQHFALKTLFGGNISPYVLNNIDLTQNAIVLDVGCGPGTWIMDTATEFPQSQFIGVDMCDIFPNNIRPANVSFQVGNVLERLPFQDNTFDFINARLFIVALKKEEWPILMKELYRILKPGGYLQCIECGMLDRGSEFIKMAGRAFTEIISARGQEPYVAFKLDSLMKNAMFNLTYFENKDVYLGRPDPLSKEFLWDGYNIFKAVDSVLAQHMGFNLETFPNFLDTLYKEMQGKPEATWSFSICIGRKTQ